MSKETFINQLQKIFSTKGLEYKKSDVNIIYEGFIQVIKDQLMEGGEVDFYGLCNISIVTRQDRSYRNIKTGKTFVSPAKKVPKIKIKKALKDLVSGEKNKVIS